MKFQKKANDNNGLLQVFRKISIILKSKIRKELDEIRFRAKPAFIIILTLFILIIPKYRLYAWDTPESESTFFLRVILPLAIILFVFREKLIEYGLGLGKKKRGLILSLIFMIGYMPFFAILYTNDSFSEYYLLPFSQLDNWNSLAIRELYSLFNLFKDEFIFRGFLLFGLRKDFGDANAILVQAIPYSLLHIGKPELECYGSVLVGVALGYLALKTKSIWYGLALHWIIATGLSFFIVYQQLN